MKNLCIILGCNSSDSSVFKIASKLEKVLNLYLELTISYIFIGDDAIQPCRGCRNCFNFGICPLDSEDFMGDVRKTITENDTIMIISPVYLDNIPGVLKNFIDRITYWLHIFFLSGKNGIILTLDDLGGWGYVEDYLFEIMNHLGINVIAKKHFEMEKYYYKESYFQEFVQSYLESIISYNNNCNSTLELLFLNKRKHMENHLTNDYKSTFWKESGMINCKTLSEWNKLKEGKQYG